MRFWSFRERFGLNNLVLGEAEQPEVGTYDVLLEMRAASLNFRDLVVARGDHGRSVQPPLVPLSDGVGTVIAHGTDVTGFKTGDRVSPSFYQHWKDGMPPPDLGRGRLGGPLDGVLATHRVFPASSLVHVPRHLSDVEAATLPCAGVTAWSALSEPNPVRPGETVLIQGSGGVALMALSLARISGAKTLMTTSSEEKAAQLYALGADKVINRNEDTDWAHAVREVTKGQGCDRVIELGGAETLNASIKAVKTGGVIILVGNVTGSIAQLNLPLVLTRRLTLHSVSCGSQQAFEQLARTIDTHHIAPVVDRTFPFEDAPAAFRALESGSHFGNICISYIEEPRS